MTAPRWVGRLLWAFRGKRRVTLHLDSRNAGEDGVTLDGVLLGRWSGHYVLELAAVLTEPGATVALDARFVEVPRERVIFVEVRS